MKTARISLTCLLTMLSMGACNKEEAPEGNPVTTVLGERTCSGEIGYVPIPWTDPDYPPIPGLLLGLMCEDKEYILTQDGLRVSDELLLFDGIRYSVGERVEITGTASFVQIPATGRDYLELEIRSIRMTEQAEHPVTTVLGERTCSGEIGYVPIPWTDPDYPPIPGLLLGLICEDKEYILTQDGLRVSDELLLFDGIRYSVGDRVEITGTASFVQIPATGRDYLELEVEAIAALPAD